MAKQFFTISNGKSTMKVNLLRPFWTDIVHHVKGKQEHRSFRSGLYCPNPADRTPVFRRFPQGGQRWHWYSNYGYPGWCIGGTVGWFIVASPVCFEYQSWGKSTDHANARPVRYGYQNHFRPGLGESWKDQKSIRCTDPKIVWNEKVMNRI